MNIKQRKRETLEWQAKEFLDNLVQKWKIKKETRDNIIDTLKKKRNPKEVEVFSGEIQKILNENWETISTKEIQDTYAKYLHNTFTERKKNQEEKNQTEIKINDIEVQTIEEQEIKKEDISALYDKFLEYIERYKWLIRKDIPQKEEVEKMFDMIVDIIKKNKDFFYAKIVSKEINTDKTHLGVLLWEIGFDEYFYEKFLSKNEIKNEINIQETLNRTDGKIKEVLKEFFEIDTNMENIEELTKKFNKQNSNEIKNKNKYFWEKVIQKVKNTLAFIKTGINGVMNIALQPLKIILKVLAFLATIALFWIGLPTFAFKRQKKNRSSQMPGIGISFIDKLMIKFFGQNTFKQENKSRGNIESPEGRKGWVDKIGQDNFNRFDIQNNEAKKSKEWSTMMEYNLPDSSDIEILKLKWYSIYTIDMKRFWSLKKWESLPIPMPYSNDNNIEFIPLAIDYTSCTIKYDKMKNLYVESKWLSSWPLTISFLVYNITKKDDMIEDLKKTNKEYFYHVPEPDPLVFSQQYELWETIEAKLEELKKIDSTREKVETLRVFLDDIFRYPRGNNIDVLKVLFSPGKNRIEKSIHAKCGNCRDINSLWYVLLRKLGIPCLFSNGYSMMSEEWHTYNEERQEHEDFMTWGVIETKQQQIKAIPMWHARVCYYDKENKKWNSTDFTPPPEKEKKEAKKRLQERKEDIENRKLRDEKIKEIIEQNHLQSEETYIHLNKTLKELETLLRNYYLKNIDMDEEGNLYEWWIKANEIITDKIAGDNFWGHPMKKNLIEDQYGPRYLERKSKKTRDKEQKSKKASHEVVREYLMENTDELSITCQKLNKHYATIYPLLITHYNKVLKITDNLTKGPEAKIFEYINELSARERIFLAKFLQSMEYVREGKMNPYLKPIFGKKSKKVWLEWRSSSTGKAIPIKWFEIDYKPQDMVKPFLRFLFSFIQLPPQIRIKDYDEEKDIYKFSFEKKEYTLSSTDDMKKFLEEIIMTREKNILKPKLDNISDIVSKNKQIHEMEKKKLDESPIDQMDNFITKITLEVAEHILDNPENKKIKFRTLTEKEKKILDIEKKVHIPFFTKKEQPKTTEKIKIVKWKVYEKIINKINNDSEEVKDLNYFDLEEDIFQKKNTTE